MDIDKGDGLSGRPSRGRALACTHFPVVQLYIFSSLSNTRTPYAIPESSPSNCSSCCTMRSLGLLAAMLALLAGLYNYLDARLDQFYIFNPDQLHDLSTRAISANGNDTRGIVDYIVAELDKSTPGNYLNLDQEWVFNNAGGAMGAMYIIHASESTVPCHRLT